MLKVLFLQSAFLLLGSQFVPSQQANSDAKALLDSGRQLLNQGTPESARQALEKFQAALARTSSVRLKTQAEGDLALAYEQLDDVPRAIEWFEKAAHLAEYADLPQAAAFMLQRSAMLCATKLDDHQRALEVVRSALVKWKSVIGPDQNALESQAEAENLAGMLYEDVDNYEEAMRHYKQAQSLAASLQDKESQRTASLASKAIADLRLKVAEKVPGPARVLLSIQSKPNTGSLSLSISPDGHLAIVVDLRYDACLWDLVNDKFLRCLGPAGQVQSASFSTSGRELVLLTSQAVSIWDVSKLSEISHIGLLFDHITSVALSSDEKRLATGSRDGVIRLWDLATRKVTKRLKEGTSPVNAVKFVPGRPLLIAGGEDGIARVWNLEVGRPTLLLENKDSDDDEASAIKDLLLSPSGNGILLVVGDARTSLWNIDEHGERFSSWSGGLGAESAAFSHDGSLLVTARYKRLEIWTIPSLTRIKIPITRDIGSIAFAQTGELITAGRDSIQVWNLQKQSVTRTLERLSKPLVTNVSPGGQFLATGSADGYLRIWDLRTGKPLWEFPGVGRVYTPSFSHDNRLIAAGGADKRLRVWDLVTGELTDQAVYDAGTECAFSPVDDNVLLIYGKEHRKMIRLRNVDSHVDTSPLVEGAPILSAQFSPTGRQILARNTEPDDKLVRIWNLDSGSQVGPLTHSDSVSAATFSPDGKRVLTGSGRNAYIWSTITGQLLFTLEPPDAMHIGTSSVGFSADGAVALTSDTATVSAWDVHTGKLIKQYPSSGLSAATAVFSPDEKYILTFSFDLRVLDRESGAVLDQISDESLFSLGLSQLGSSDNGPAVLPVGRAILTKGSDGLVRLFTYLSRDKRYELISLPDGVWVWVDDDGHFDTNNFEKLNAVNWLVSDDPFNPLPLEIFTRDYYVPHLLAHLFDNAPSGQLLPLGKLNRAQPREVIVSTKPEGDGVAVTINVKSSRSEVQRDADGKYLESGAYDLRLFRDGQLVGQWPEVTQDLRVSSGVGGGNVQLESWRRLHKVKLHYGEYTHTFHHIRLPQRAGVKSVHFTAYAFNSDRVKGLTTKPLEHPLRRAANSAASAPPRRAYLITMGVNANDSRWNLDFAVPSAQAAGHLLHDKLSSEYQVVDVTLFSTLAPDSPQVMLQQATRPHLKTVLDLLAGRRVDDMLRQAVDPDHKIEPATPDDAVVLFISSHGYADPQGNFYVVPYDTGGTPNRGVTEDILTRCRTHRDDSSLECQRANRFLEHTISSQDLARWWSGVDAGEMIMILDSCHSGAVPGRQFRPGPLGDPGFGQLSYDKGMRILSATQPDKAARATLMQELGHSLLVEALLQQAATHAQDSLDAWLHDAQRAVPALTHQLYPEFTEADTQTPELFDFGRTRKNETN